MNPHLKPPAAGLARGAALAVALCGAALTAGCGAQRVVPLKAEEATQWRSIAVVAARDPEAWFAIPGTPALRQGTEALEAVGRVGAPVPPGAGVAAAATVVSTATVDALRARSAGQQLTQALPPAQLRLADTWNQALPQALQQRGLQVRLLPAGAASETTEHCPGLAPGVDAVLVARLSAGYAGDDGLRPSVAVLVKLMSPDCRRTLHSQLYTQGAALFGPAQPGAVAPAASNPAGDDRHRFANLDALRADPARAGAGLRERMADTAAAVAQALRPWRP